MRLPFLYLNTLDKNVIRLEELQTPKVGIGLQQIPNHVKGLLRHGYWRLIRRGLYCVVPVGKKPNEMIVDKMLVGAKVASDSILAYRSALEFHGLSRSVQSEVTFLSDRVIHAFEFNGILYRRVANPISLRRHKKTLLYVTQATYCNNAIKITNRERTLVDSIHRPDLSGNLEEIIHAIQACPSIETQIICKYLLDLQLPSVLCKTGFLLEKYGAKTGVKSEQLEILRKHLPKFVPYLDENDKRVRFDRRLHLFVPKRLESDTTLAT